MYRCGKYFSDSEATTEITLVSTVIAKLQLTVTVFGGAIRDTENSTVSVNTGESVTVIADAASEGQRFDGFYMRLFYHTV